MSGTTAVILIVGDEILDGHTQDTNSHWLAGRLRARGVRLLRIETHPDDVATVADAIRRLARHPTPEFLFVVGGIGPTPDDRTYEAVARALEVPLEARPERLEWLRAREIARGRDGGIEASQGLRRMVMLPAGTQELVNPVGSALGCVGQAGETQVVVLPGVPRELYAMFGDVFEPQYLGGRSSAVVVREIVERGAEARLYDALLAVERAHATVRVGSYPQADGRIILRLSGPEKDVLEAENDLKARVRPGPKE